MRSRRTVVTGVGLIGAAGTDAAATWKSLVAGESGLRPLTLFRSLRHGHIPVGQIPGAAGALQGGLRGSRSDRLAWVAAREALTAAGLWGAGAGRRRDRCGVLIGATTGGMLATEALVESLLAGRTHGRLALRFHECVSSAVACAGALGWEGPCGAISTACSSGAMAILLAGELIEAGAVSTMLVGGCDSLCRLTLNGFGSLLLLDPAGCRPFDASRGGMSLGEGAGFLVLEEERAARARGAMPLARLSGWGASCDSHHVTAPHPEGDGALAAMRLALENAGLDPAQVGYVNAHGTGTRDNDLAEAKALRRLFEGAIPPFSSVKRCFGHTLGASGAIEAAVCVLALAREGMPPNGGFDRVDPEIELEPLRAFRGARFAHALSNSFGFGGNNVAIVLSQPDADRSIRACSRSRPCPGEIWVMGCGTVSPSGHAGPEMLAAWRTGRLPAPSRICLPEPFAPRKVPVLSCGEGWDDAIPATARRRLGRLQRMALSAALSGAASIPPDRLAGERTCVVFGSGLGAAGEGAMFVENLVARGEQESRPQCFVNSVNNSCSARIALALGAKGLNSAPTAREITFELGLWQAARELERGRADRALVGAADELTPYLLDAGLRWGWWAADAEPVAPFGGVPTGSRRPVPGEGATAFVLAGPESAGEPLGKLCGVFVGRWRRGASGGIDAVVEAEWIARSLGSVGRRITDLDLLLTGAGGGEAADRRYREVGRALAGLGGVAVECGAYKQWCGEHHAASAFGFLVGLGLLRGEIRRSAVLGGQSEAGAPGGGACRFLALYTLGDDGAKGLCLLGR